MIRNLLFDLGGVLIDLDVHRSLRAFSALSSATSPSSEGAWGCHPFTGFDLLGGGESELMRRYQTGAISTDEFFSAVLSVCRPDVTQGEVLAAWYAMLGEIPAQRMEMLRRLKAAGYRLFILSNINEAHVRWVQTHYPELHELCEQVFYSNEIRIAKPDQAAYDYVLSHADILPQETLYIDDLDQNIEAGRRAGFVALRALGDEWLPHAEALL